MSETSFLVEQAVFSTNLARRTANGRNEAALLNATEDASRADLDAALDWASRVETFDGGYDPRNLFFFPTSSGAFAIGRLTPAAPEAGEGAFYFQTFFVEEDAFFQCGANPVALLHFALNTAKFSLYRPGAKLEAFRLEARAPWIDQEELRRTTERLGTRALTTLIQATLEAKRAAFVADYNAFLVVAALFELTPMNWRPALTFAVGVRFRNDVALRLLGATLRRGVDESGVVSAETACCDLRDVVENDDAYPIENAWAALVELALKSNRVDFLYERMATDFFLYRNLDDGARVASSEEVAALGLRWRFELERALREEAENGVADAFDGRSEAENDGEEDEAARDGERSDEAESFFNGEFEGGWRDSDGDERWRIDAVDADAEKRPKPEERVGPEFVWKVVEPTEAERAAEAEAREREKSREKNAPPKKNDNNLKKNDGAGCEGRGRTASADEVFAGESFEDEWAATEKEEGRSEKDDAKASAARESNVRAGEKKRGEEGTERDEKSAKSEKEEALEALRQIFGGPQGVVGADGKRLLPIAASCEELCELLLDDAFDAPPGLRPLANWDAFLGERGAEALKRLARAARRDDERDASDRNVRRLRLAPFAALSAEFPDWNEELRRFDALFDDACGGNDAAAEALRVFWRSWRSELDEETVGRIRGAYEERLRGRLAAEDGGAVARTERWLAALAIYNALFGER